MHQIDRSIPRQQGSQQFPPARSDGFAALAAMASEESRPTDIPKRQGGITLTDVLTLPPAKNLIHALAEIHNQVADVKDPSSMLTPSGFYAPQDLACAFLSASQAV